MKGLLLLYLLLFFNSVVIKCEIFSGRIRGDDEPKIVSWKVLEGITEPFDSNQKIDIPTWKLMKNAADQKAASLMIQQALHEYGQLLRHPNMFGEMPMEERYDVFLSMSKLLQVMGFHQRAELLLYEAMSYTTKPHDAHFQLATLFLDKEDLNMAKIHLKNCLYFRENDIVILIYLAMISMSESKIHEAKFFISRIIMGLQEQSNKLSNHPLPSSINNYIPEVHQMNTQMEHMKFYRWVEDILSKSFRGEVRITPLNIMESLEMFSKLYTWLNNGEYTGRYLFDLGQSLYEVGYSTVGKMMMLKGHETTDVNIEGIISTEVVKARLAFDFPVISSSIYEIVEAYFNMTNYLSSTSNSYSIIDIENIVDIYWPLPLLDFAALPMWPVVQELFWRFTMNDVNKLLPKRWWNNVSTNTLQYSLYDYVADGQKKMKESIPTIRIAIFGGHMNNHPVGQAVLNNLLGFSKLRKTFDNAKFHITLLALGVVSDLTTKRIAANVNHIINLPLNIQSAYQSLLRLKLDILLIPDWQPFPDAQSVAITRWRGIAPVTICFYVRGGSCASDAVDYYLLPEQLGQAYLNAVPATTIDTVWNNFNDDTNIPQNSTATQSTLHFNAKVRQPWRERFGEQVVLLDWSILTGALIKIVSKSVTHLANLESQAEKSEHERNHGNPEEYFNDDVDITISTHGEVLKSIQFVPHEQEGRVFFEGQPVAIVAAHPTYVHPLMDEILFRVLRNVPTLQILLIQSQSFLGYTNDLGSRMSWGRKLVRRLWSNAGDLFHRIRLLPTPTSDTRLLQLLRQADMVLDTFPLGTSFYPIALALSVGTPVVTIRPGIILQTPHKDLATIKQYLQRKRQSHVGNPLFQHIMHHDNLLDHAGVDQNRNLRALTYRLGDVPWLPTSGIVAGFYDSIGLGASLVGNTTSEYTDIIIRLATDRESAYDLRVQILELIDEQYKEPSNNKTKSFADLCKFFVRVGLPWAKEREKLYPNHQYDKDTGNIEPVDAIAVETKTKKSKKRVKRNLDDDFNIEMAGGITS